MTQGLQERLLTRLETCERLRNLCLEIANQPRCFFGQQGHMGLPKTLNRS